MKIKSEVIKRIDGNDAIVVRLVKEMKVSYPTVRRWILANDEDGDLTTAKALSIISAELKLSNRQILEETKTAA